MSRTPAARALVGCLALNDGAALNQAARLAGYELKVASPVSFYRGRCYRPDGAGAGRLIVVRDGRIVRVSASAHELSGWMFRLGKKLAGLQLRTARAA